MQGKPLFFRGAGIHNCSLTVADAQTRSSWLVAEGIAVNGPMKGEILERIPTYHTTYGEWLAIHPDTLVMSQPEDPNHIDQRHGHGDEEWYGRPGVSPAFVRTLGENPDTRLPENAMILSATHGATTRLYPVEDIKNEGGVVHDVLDEQRIVVWTGPAPTSFWTAAFYATLDGRDLTFKIAGDAFVDVETGSTWSVEGKALTGPMTGQRLDHVSYTFLRFHGWAWGHKQNDIYRSSGQRLVDEGGFIEFLNTLRANNYDVSVDAELLNLELPNEASTGLFLHINQDRFKIVEFSSRSTAEDYAFGKPHSVRSGKVVLESSPDDHLQFLDTIHSRLLSDDRIPWSNLIDTNDFVGRTFIPVFNAAFPEVEKDGLSLVDLLKGIEERGYEVEIGVDYVIEGIRTGRWMVETPRSHLRVGGLNAIFASVNGDPFLVHKFKDEDAAQTYLDNEENHAFHVGPVVFRSAPKDMYYNKAGFGEKPHDQISWSTLLTDEDFITTVATVLGI